MLGAGLTVAHDMLTCSIFFFLSIAWALRAIGARNLSLEQEQDSGVKAESCAFLKAEIRLKHIGGTDMRVLVYETDVLQQLVEELLQELPARLLSKGAGKGTVRRFLRTTPFSNSSLLAS